jgi:nitrogen fixation NifU-like protein
VSDLGKLYQKSILEHDKAPRHALAVAAPTHRAETSNPLCGDRVALTLRVVERRIVEVGCEVKGCSICRASGSMLAERVLAAELSEVLAVGRRFIAALAPASVEPAPAREAAASDAWGPLAALLEARRYPSRQRCATLPWEALEQALRDAP